MLIARRRLLSLGLAALPLVAAPALAGEACQPIDPAKGIVFKRQEGTRGLVRREGDGTLVIDYVTNKGDWMDRRRSRMGIFELGRELNESEYPLVGSAPPEWVWKFPGKLPEPEAGKSWSGTVRETLIQISYGEEMKENRSETKSRWQATYRFLERKEVKISGCFYLILPVEAEFVSGAAKRSQRWIYFEREGFAIETRADGKDNGIVAMTPA